MSIANLLVPNKFHIFADEFDVREIIVDDFEADNVSVDDVFEKTAGHNIVVHNNLKPNVISTHRLGQSLFTFLSAHIDTVNTDAVSSIIGPLSLTTLTNGDINLIPNGTGKISAQKNVLVDQIESRTTNGNLQLNPNGTGKVSALKNVLVDQIESRTTNGNLQLNPNGTGVTEFMKNLIFTGSNQTSLGAYEEFDEVITIAANPIATQSLTLKIIRIGKHVCVTVPNLAVAGNNNAGAFTFSAISARFRPTVGLSVIKILISALENNVVVLGAAALDSNGVISAGIGVASVNYAASLNGQGFRGFSFCYNIN